MLLARAPAEPLPTPRPMRAPSATRLQRGPLAPGLAFAMGLFAAFGFAPTGVFACTVFGLAALVVLCEAAPRRAAVLGWMWGLGHFGFGVRWIAEAFAYQDKMPHWTGWLAVTGLAALLATMPAIACWLTWRFARRAPALARLWAFPAAWMATEWLRGHLFTGFPWNTLAAATLGDAGLPWPVSVALAWPAALIGALGLSGVIALVAAAIGQGRWRFAALVVLVVALATGAHRAWLGARAPEAARTTELVVVQPNIGQSEKWDPAEGPRNLERLLRLSRSAPSPRPGIRRVILWPESALAEYEAETDPPLRTRLASLLRPGDLLLTGGLSVRYNLAGEPVAATNSAFVIDHTATIRARYDKSHLVPGGEYVPLRPIADTLGLSRLAPGDVDFTPGPGARTVPLPGGVPPVGPLICYEMIFPSAIVDEAHRPAWLFNPSNDGWFADTGPWQHLALARLRAIEEGLPIARSTPTGVSALIGPDGALLATVAQRMPGVIVARLPREAPPTPYSRAGDFIPFGLGALALTAARRARPRRT